MKSTVSPAATDLSIGAAAGRFGLATHVLRHWESAGLLAPRRDAGGRRRYGPADLDRVAAILRAKRAGLPLDRIRELLDGTGPAARRAALERQRGELLGRIAEARASLALVECALGCPHDDPADCPHAGHATHEAHVAQ
ncbi:MerR family transcriptional regulator [Streptomyces sp. 8K308]|uniref:MerR family transcriptional regulator n=1 Tax=Streptomyces sp. 8K308 TaxID=2530388 RepID=UPI001042E1EA|nr:MerR family transcriptional regulator [Streptomyces sp. 8K308]TDC21002.1 MerR family transcriptional regulator [Streptomyces sp. 8K308]